MYMTGREKAKCVLNKTLFEDGQGFAGHLGLYLSTEGLCGSPRTLFKDGEDFVGHLGLYLRTENPLRVTLCAADEGFTPEAAKAAANGSRKRNCSLCTALRNKPCRKSA